MFVDDIQQLRKKLHGLDVSSAYGRKIYERVREAYIAQFEGCVLHVYEDAVGLKTVGFGFNMDRPDALAEWQEAFRDTIAAPRFEDVYVGARDLLPDESKTLFRHGLQLRERYLKKSYKNIWHKLRANERLTTESANYNAASLVQGPFCQRAVTRYYKYLEKYVLEGDMKALKSAVTELAQYSNRRNLPGLKARRQSEAELLSSFKVLTQSNT